MQVRPVGVLEQCFRPSTSFTVDRSVDRGKGTLTISLWFKKLPSSEILSYFCEGAGVDVNLKGLRIRLPRNMNWQGTKKEFEDWVYRQLVVAAVLNQLHDQSKFERDSEQMYESPMSGTSIYIKLEGPSGRTGAVSLDLGVGGDAREDEAITKLAETLAQYPLNVSVKIKDRAPTPELIELIGRGVGCQLRAVFGA